MCRFSKLLLFSFFFCKDGSDRLMKRASYSCCNFFLRCAYCCLLEVSPVSLVVLAIRLAIFFIVTHTHTHVHAHSSYRSTQIIHFETQYSDIVFMYSIFFLVISCSHLLFHFVKQTADMPFCIIEPDGECLSNITAQLRLIIIDSNQEYPFAARSFIPPSSLEYLTRSLNFIRSNPILFKSTFHVLFQHSEFFHVSSNLLN